MPPLTRIGILTPFGVVTLPEDEPRFILQPDLTSALADTRVRGNEEDCREFPGSDMLTLLPSRSVVRSMPLPTFVLTVDENVAAWIIVEDGEWPGAMSAVEEIMWSGPQPVSRTASA